MTWHPDMPSEYRNAIITGDARGLARAIPDESIDLIFTDPVYDRIEDYAWLAEAAARVLKPGGACLVWTFNSEIDAVLSAMRGYLRYRYQLCWRRFGPIYHGVSKFICVATYCLWLDRGGDSTMSGRIADLIDAAQGGLHDNTHQWSKPRTVIAHWLGAFSRSGAIVFDPFTGGGTVPAVCKMLGRNYIAFEIDPATAARARARVELTQAMHPILLGVQEPMELAV